MADPVVIILAILSGFGPAMLFDGIVVKNIAPGVMQKNYGDHRTVDKATGVFLIIVEFAIGAGFAYYANMFFEEVFTQSGAKVWLWFFPVSFFLVLGARARVGGNWGWKEILLLITYFIVSCVVIYFGFGGGTTSAPSSP